MKYLVSPTSKFKKDLKRIRNRGYNINLLCNIIEKLKKGESLSPRNKDHSLIREYIGFRECHIEPDWLLIYMTDDDTLYLARTGTHSDLFK